MANQIVRSWVDDMDGQTELSEADGDAIGFRFAAGDTVFEIDTTAENANSIMEFLQPFMDAGRIVGKLPSSGPYLIKSPGKTQASRSLKTREQTKTIRDWANANGFELADRGRIPDHVVTAYEAAHTKGGRPKATAKVAAPATEPELTAAPPAKTTTRGKTAAARTTKAKAPTFKGQARTETA